MKPKPTTFSIPTAARRRQRGQAMVEYVIVALVLAIALFVPVPITGIQPTQTAAQLLASKIHDLYDNLTFFLSLP